jgi:hypothetical protein
MRRPACAVGHAIAAIAERKNQLLGWIATEDSRHHVMDDIDSSATSSR